jgi:hypothetical protein
MLISITTIINQEKSMYYNAMLNGQPGREQHQAMIQEAETLRKINQLSRHNRQSLTAVRMGLVKVVTGITNVIVS